MKQLFFRIVTKVTIFATVFLTVLGTVTPSAYATAFTSVRLDLSRVQAATATSSTFTIVLPAGVNWDATTASDTIVIAYPTSSSLWVFTTPNWTSSDFLIYDGTQQVTIATLDVASSTVVGAGYTTNPVTCVTGGTGSNNGSVFINATDLKFYFRRCGGTGGVAPANAATIKITIKGGGSGTLTTPAAGASLVQVDLQDEVYTTTHSTQIATSIIASDVTGASGVAPTAPVLTFTIGSDPMTSSAAGACSAATVNSSTTFSFANPLSVSQVNNALTSICTSVTSTVNASTTVYIYSAHGGLSLNSGASTWLNSGGAAYTTATQKTLTVGTSKDDGVCVLTAGTGASDTLTGGTVTASSPYSGTCNYTSMASTEKLGTIPTLASTGLNALWTTSPTSAVTIATHILPRVVLTTATTAGTYTETYYLVASSAF